MSKSGNNTYYIRIPGNLVTHVSWESMVPMLFINDVRMSIIHWFIIRRGQSKKQTSQAMVFVFDKYIFYVSVYFHP